MASESAALKLIVFFLELPAPIAIPHGSTCTMVLDEKVPGLAGIGISPIPGVQPRPNPEGHNSASFKFWQVKRLYGREPALDDVLKAVIPARSRGGSRRPRDGSRAPRGYVTIVEASTLLTEATKSGASDAFDKCLASLEDLLRGYSLATHRALPLVTRESLPPLVVLSRRSLLGQEWDRTLSAMMINTNVGAESPEALDAETMRLVMQNLSDLKMGHPIIPYLEAGARARRALVEEGNYQDAVIYREMGVEILIDALLTLLLWEEGVPAIDAANTVFDHQLPWRIEEAIASRLGGDWRRKGTGPISRWESKLAYLRGRVVHGGYRPTLEEAREALDIGSEIDKLTRARIAVKAGRFPKTALLILGQAGLRRLNAWTKRVQKVAEAADPPEWLRDYSAWRRALDAERINLIR